MKGLIHTDAFMHALLNTEHGLRLPGRRVSHAFLCDIPSYSKLLVITDAAINIAPDLNAKAQILQNAIELCHLLGIETPKVAVLSAVETINPAISSTLDAACLTLMAQRGQITGAVVDGPLAFDNAISLKAAKGKRHNVQGCWRLRHPPRARSGLRQHPREKPGVPRRCRPSRHRPRVIRARRIELALRSRAGAARRPRTGRADPSPKCQVRRSGRLLSNRPFNARRSLSRHAVRYQDEAMQITPAMHGDVVHAPYAWRYVPRSRVSM